MTRRLVIGSVLSGLLVAVACGGSDDGEGGGSASGGSAGSGGSSAGSGGSTAGSAGSGGASGSGTAGASGSGTAGSAGSGTSGAAGSAGDRGDASAGSGGKAGGGGDRPSINELGTRCNDQGACPKGLTATKYCGLGGCGDGGGFCSCEIPCGTGNDACPEGTECLTIADGPGTVCVRKSCQMSSDCGAGAAVVCCGHCGSQACAGQCAQLVGGHCPGGQMQL